MFQAEPALVYDSVQVFAHGLAALDRSHDLRPANLSCEKEEPWDDGLSLYNYINAVRTFCEFSSEPLGKQLMLVTQVFICNYFREISYILFFRKEREKTCNKIIENFTADT